MTVYAIGVYSLRWTTPAVPVTVAELPAFAREEDRILGERSHHQRIDFLGLHPGVSVIVPDTGGVRKHSEDLPILAISIYAKNEKVDMTPEDRRRMKAEIREYVSFHREDKQ